MAAFRYNFGCHSFRQYAKEITSVVSYQLDNGVIGNSIQVLTMLSPIANTTDCDNKNCDEGGESSLSLESKSFFQESAVPQDRNANLGSTNPSENPSPFLSNNVYSSLASCYRCLSWFVDGAISGDNPNQVSTSLSFRAQSSGERCFFFLKLSCFYEFQRSKQRAGTFSSRGTHYFSRCRPFFVSSH